MLQSKSRTPKTTLSRIAPASDINGINRALSSFRDEVERAILLGAGSSSDGSSGSQSRRPGETRGEMGAVGPQGDQGPQGMSFAQFSVDSDGNLVLTHAGGAASEDFTIDSLGQLRLTVA